MRVVLALAVVAGVLLAGCGGGGDTEPAEGAPTDVAGLIVETTREDGRVAGFTLETDAGMRYDIAVEDDLAYGFQLEHLEQHRRDRIPVRCLLEERAGKLVALSIVDA